jgi:hypothetical protein
MSFEIASLNLFLSFVAEQPIESRQRILNILKQKDLEQSQKIDQICSIIKPKNLIEYTDTDTNNKEN